MNKNEKTNTIIQAFLPKIISDEWIELTKDELYHICQCVDYNKVSDRTLADKEELHDIIPWQSIDRMKILRVVARNVNITGFVDLSKYNYTVKEAKNMLRIHPYLIDYINIDLMNLNKEEAFSLLTIGAVQITEKIDVKNYIFTPKETYEIIEQNRFSNNIIRRLNLKDLKDYHISNIIIQTGDVHFDILDLAKLTARKWVEILQFRPELFCFCNFEKFKQSDIFNSVELVCLFDEEDLHFLIKDRNYKEELSPFGWEKLIINHPDEYIENCSYWKLSETNWKNILSIHPHLAVFKI